MKVLMLFLFVLMTKSFFAQSVMVNNYYEKGELKDGYKEGTWEYYDHKGELSLKIDYTTTELLFLKKDTSEFVVKQNEGWSKLKMDISPRYIGSMVEFYKILSKNTIYPHEALENEIVGTLFISFEIDTSGHIGNYQAINDIGYKCSDAAINALKLVPNLWISAQKNEKNYTSKFILPVTFKMIEGEKEIQSMKKNKIPITEIPLAKQLEELVITAVGKPK